MRTPVALFHFALALALLGAFAAPSHAGQTAPASELPQLFGAYQPELGVWSQYEVVETLTGKTTRMRMAIVGQEGDSYWYEVDHQEEGRRNIVKMLVAGNPNDPDNIRRLILKTGGNPATEMPRDFVAMGRRMALHMFRERSGVPAQAEQAGYRVEAMPPAPITVKAGSFEASLRRIFDAEGKEVATFYFNAEVAPFGVVSSATESTTMELLAYGRDATSAIQETPVPMTTPPGMPTGIPRGVPPGMPVKTTR